MSALAAVLILMVLLVVPFGYVMRASWRTTGSQIDSVIESVLSQPTPAPLRALTRISTQPVAERGEKGLREDAERDVEVDVEVDDGGECVGVEGPDGLGEWDTADANHGPAAL